MLMMSKISDFERGRIAKDPYRGELEYRLGMVRKELRKVWHAQMTVVMEKMEDSMFSYLFDKPLHERVLEFFSKKISDIRGKPGKKERLAMKKKEHDEELLKVYGAWERMFCDQAARITARLLDYYILEPVHPVSHPGLTPEIYAPHGGFVYRFSLVLKEGNEDGESAQHIINVKGEKLEKSVDELVEQGVSSIVNRFIYRSCDHMGSDDVVRGACIRYFIDIAGVDSSCRDILRLGRWYLEINYENDFLELGETNY